MQKNIFKNSHHLIKIMINHIKINRINNYLINRIFNLINFKK